MKKLDNKVAWVSGAAKGIGEGIARYLAEQGAAVAVIDVDVQAGLRLQSEIRKAGGAARFIECDVADDASVASGIEATVEAFGGLHIVVNNAGMQHVAKLHEFPEAMWDRQMGVNVKSVFLSFRHAYPHLKKNAQSYVINVGSISCFVGQAKTPVYLASKGAMIQLTKAIALDYACDGIRCNCVCPGITDSDMLRKHLQAEPDPDQHLAQRLRRVPLGEMLTPRHIAQAVLYFACDDSHGITGTSITIDGGYTAAAEWDTEFDK